MRIVLVILVLIVAGMALDWFREARKEQEKKIAEAPHSENYILGNLERGKTGAAKIALNGYGQAFVMYKVNRGKNPPALRDLVDDGYLPSGAENDPFGQLYELKYAGKEAIITSPGADHVRGTPDDIVERIVVE
jgi:hypothetical protein